MDKEAYKNPSVSDMDNKNVGASSLGALAKNHLSGATATTSAKKGNFEIPDIFGGGGGGIGGASKSTAAAAQAGRFQIPDIFGPAPTPASGGTAPPLALAALGGAPSTKLPGGFLVPGLFGTAGDKPRSNAASSAGVSSPTSANSSSAIDLMQALRLNEKAPAEVRTRNSLPPSAPATQIKTAPKEEEEDPVDRLTLDFFRNLPRHFHSDFGHPAFPERASSFGRVVCRDWSGAYPAREPSLFISLGTRGGSPSPVQPFCFDTPSPDDLVLRAQSASTGFRRGQLAQDAK